MEEGEVDLERLALRSGQAARIELRLRPDDPVIGGEPFPIEGGVADATIDVSRTSSGFALKLTTETTLSGPCARCLEAALLSLAVEAREVEQAGAGDPELSSPYVTDGVLDATAWLHDAITLELPEKVLCRSDCAGICDVCGARLNDFGPGEHTHERPPDPRFAKLRELGSDGD